MSDRPTIEKEISDYRQTIGKVEKDVRQLRDWIATNERALTGMQDTLRHITAESITRARSDLAQRETDLQRLLGALAHNEQILRSLKAIERKQQDIAALEREQEKITGLLDRHRRELWQLQASYDELTHPTILPSCELVLPNNQRMPLDAHKGAYTLGWRDTTGEVPDIDLHPMGGSTSGVSRKHALLRFTQGQWMITDLGSTNGTFVNDTAIAPHTPVALHDKTRIRLGTMVLFFRYIMQTTRL